MKLQFYKPSPCGLWVVNSKHKLSNSQGAKVRQQIGGGLFILFYFIFFFESKEIFLFFSNFFGMGKRNTRE